MLAHEMSNQPASPTLVGLEEGRKSVFGTGPESPSKRTFAEWKAKGFFPYVKVGKRVFVDSEQVRAALERRFKINAVAIK
ncbi:MAG: hypothetical protein WCO57_00870 [Verrucomicrobiota bacterium]